MMRWCLAGLLALWPLNTQAQPMTFQEQFNWGNCYGCTWVAATGEITPGTPAAFRAFLAPQGFLPETGILMFDSPGGDLAAAQELGRILREIGAITTVGVSMPEPIAGQTPWSDDGPARCVGACVLALLGGEARWVTPGELVVAPFYQPQGGDVPTAQTQQIMGDLVLYLIEMGINPELLGLANRAPMGVALGANELQRLAIATSRDVTPHRLAAQQGGLVVLRELLDDSREIARYYQLRCSAAQQAWLVTVRQPGTSRDTISFEYGPFIEIAGTTIDLDTAALLEAGPVGPDGGDMQITFRLPVDIRETPAADFEFRIHRHRSNYYFLNVEGTLPDAATLDAMVRACGD